MNLQPVDGQPGLWQNQDWTPGSPGTFVLLIGVSAYDFLTGGTGHTVDAESYGLGQLAVSAWTAFGLFEWFRADYQYGATAPVPVAQVWLLLSPTAAELAQITAQDPAIASHLLRPSFGACQQAVVQWTRAMNGLPQAAAEQSRAFFFFSGHGLEIFQGEQILLPSDYLELGLLNNALNVRKLAEAMTTMAVRDQFFFVDACRNDYDKLRLLDIRGNGILTVAQANLTNPANNYTILYATASGMPSFQPTSPPSYSLFGQSLLDGLSAREGFVPDCQNIPCTVQLALLHCFIAKRYNILLAGFGWKTIQYVKQGGQPSDPLVTVTQVVPVMPAPASTLEGLVMPAPELPSVLDLQTAGFTQKANVSPAPAPLTTDLPTTHNMTGERFQIEPDNADTLESVLESMTEPAAPVDLHGLLGRESVTAFWEGARVYSLETHRWIPGKCLLLHRVERTDDNTGYRLTFSLDGLSGRHWLQLADSQTTFGIALPGDESMSDPKVGVPRYRLEFTTLPDPQTGFQVTTMRADLSTDNADLTGTVAGLWDKYQTVDAATAANEIDMERFQDAVHSKAKMPLAATVGALILLRARRFDLAEGTWLLNLVNWFPTLPDGLLLRNLWLLAQPNPALAYPDVINNLCQLRGRGFPYIGEVLGLAVRQTETMLTAIDSGQGADGMRPVDGLADLQLLNTQLRTALRYFRPGGLLAVFAGPPEAVSPQALGYK